MKCLAQPRRQLKPIEGGGQIEVGEQNIWCERPGICQPQRRRPIRRDCNMMALVLQKQLQKRAHLRIILDDKHCSCPMGGFNGVDVLAVGAPFRLPRGLNGRERHFDGEDRAFAGFRADAHLVAEQFPKALNDGQAEAKPPAARPFGVADLVVLLENGLHLVAGDAHAGVPDFHTHCARPPPAAEKYFSMRRIFHGIREQIADHLLQQPRVAAHRDAARRRMQAQALRLGEIGILVPQAGQHIIDPEPGEVRLHGAHLDLVAVEQGVQHARHGTQGLIEARHEVPRLLAIDRPRQKPLQKGQRLQRLAQVMAGHGEEARLSGIGLLRLQLRFLQGLADAIALADIGEGDDHAFPVAAMGPVRQNPAHEPDAGTSFDFPFDRCQAEQHRAGIGGKCGVGGERVQIGQRAPDVARNDVEQRFRGRREEPDVEVHVEEQRRDIGAVEDVLKVVRRGALALQGFLKLAVECGQLFIGRLVLLVDGQRLLVDRLLLFT